MTRSTGMVPSISSVAPARSPRSRWTRLSSSRVLAQVACGDPAREGPLVVNGRFVEAVLFVAQPAETAEQPGFRGPVTGALGGRQGRLVRAPPEAELVGEGERRRAERRGQPGGERAQVERGRSLDDGDEAGLLRFEHSSGSSSSSARAASSKMDDSSAAMISAAPGSDRVGYRLSPNPGPEMHKGFI
ncbi:hypothetical protein AB0M80_15515 [Amycolatopsis sp. NPDC051045]|uniref:hypothetical protein n=1 Tax=Amycolatopsis sp. NPDC051045 TaxID=3156922 RepID=UPI003414EFAC